MKKIMVSLALLILILGLSSCSKSNGHANSQTNGQTDSQTADNEENEENGFKQYEDFGFEGIEFDTESECLYITMRNRSDESISDVTLNIDLIDEQGDIVDSTYAKFRNVLASGQACTMEALWVDHEKKPVGTMISTILYSVVGGDDYEAYLSPPFVVKNIKGMGNSNEVNYTYDEIVMYLNLYIGYKKALDSLKNPLSAQFLGIRYDSTNECAYYCVVAENSFGGNIKSYFKYDADAETVSENDGYKSKYTDCTIERSLDEIMSAYEIISSMPSEEIARIEESHEKEAQDNEYTYDEEKMYETILAGEEELFLLVDDLIIIDYYWHEGADTAFYFILGDYEGEPTGYYAAYHKRYGVNMDISEKVVNEAVEVTFLDMLDYKSSIEKDIHN